MDYHKKIQRVAKELPNVEHADALNMEIEDMTSNVPSPKNDVVYLRATECKHVNDPKKV